MFWNPFIRVDIAHLFVFIPPFINLDFKYREWTKKLAMSWIIRKPTMSWMNKVDREVALLLKIVHSAFVMRHALGGVICSHHVVPC